MTAPSVRARLSVALAIAMASMLVVIYDSIAAPGSVPDFDQTWFAAKALLQGRDPYALIGPDREFAWPWPFYYPLTAPLSILPLGFLPLPVARVVFVALPAGLLAFRLTRDGYGRLPFFASGAFILTVKTVQWSPVIACGLLMPWLGFFGAAKPNLGLSAVAGASSRAAFAKMAVGMAVLTVGALALEPQWPERWREAVSTAPHFVSFASFPEGALLLLAILRWRRWEARLLLVLSVLPLTPMPHSILLLLLIPNTRASLTMLGILSYVPLIPIDATGSFTDVAGRIGRLTLWSVVFPTLWLVMKRPNVGPVPASFERRLTRFPRWLRGAPGPAWDPLSAGNEPVVGPRDVASLGPY